MAEYLEELFKDVHEEKEFQIKNARRDKKQ